MNHLGRILVHAWLRTALACLLIVAAIPTCAAHDPLVLATSVVVDGATVTVTLEVKQWALLAALGDQRSLFTDRADLERARPRLGAYLSDRIVLRIGDLVIPLAPAADEAGGTAAGELPDPLRFTLEGRAPAGAGDMSIALDAFKELGATAAVIDNVRVGGLRVAPVMANVKPGERVAWTVRALGSGTDAAPERISTARDFLRLGFLHIVGYERTGSFPWLSFGGLDHILFVVGLFLLSPKLKPLLTQVTAFTIAHSLTLGLAMAGILTLPSRVVEPLIALSIAVVAIENVFARRVHPWRWMIVFAFGLVHGLGFAGALRGMQLPPGGILEPLVCFNVGVEGGQLAVIAAAAAVTFWCWKRDWYRPWVVVPASTLIACIGLFWAIQRAMGYGIGE